MFQQVLHQGNLCRSFPLIIIPGIGCPIIPGIGCPIEDIGKLPLSLEVIDTEAVIIIPGYPIKIGGLHEVLDRPFPPGVVEVVVGRRGVIVVPAAHQQIGACLAKERLNIHDALHCILVFIGAELLISTDKP